MKTLRPYQDAALKSLFQYLFTKPGHPLVVAPVAAGKSLMIAEFIRQLHEIYPRARVVMLTHVKELLVQNAEELDEQYFGCDFGFYCAGLGQKRLHNDVTFASIQSIHNKVGNFNRIPEIIIIDECFTGETLIKTNRGDVRIDKVRLGDIVYNATGYGEILAISKKLSSVIYKVRLDNGQEIRCTGNHPFLSEQGWFPAKELDKGSRVFGIQDMPMLWKTISSMDIESNEKRKDGGYNSAETLFPKTKVLLDILLEEDGKCYVDTGRQRESIKKIKRDRAQAIHSWWEWQRDYRASSENVENTRGRVGGGSCNTDKSSEKDEVIPHLLQGRFGAQRKKTGDRVGRRLPLRKKEDIRREERQFSDVVRVESVEIEEQGGGEFVYNLQVSGHPSYFSNGILVHNCHLISHKSETQYRKFIDAILSINPNCRVIGFTGTPFRSDTGRLDDGKGKLFDAAAYEIGMDYMIEQGYWAKPVCPEIAAKMDVSGVSVRGGDYVAGELERKINTHEINDACVRELIEKGANRRKWLVFTAGIKHCEDVCMEIHKAGITVAHITSDTPLEERNANIERFRRGEIRCLVNVAVLTTGFNVPDIDLLCFMRPTRSPVLYIQTVGRGVRPVYADGYDLSTQQGRLDAIAASIKPDCMIVDFGGVVDELGPIDMVFIKKRYTEEKENSEDNEPIIKICPSCGTECAPAQTYCYSCSYCFIYLDSTASNKAVVSCDVEPEWVEVLGMYSTPHYKQGGFPTMKVTYATMSAPIREWICFEHHNYEVGDNKRYAWNRAVQWHKERFPDMPPPTSVEDAIDIDYPTPKRILIKKDGKYWRILDYEFPIEQAEQRGSIDVEEYFEIPF